MVKDLFFSLGNKYKNDLETALQLNLIKELQLCVKHWFGVKVYRAIRNKLPELLYSYHCHLLIHPPTTGHAFSTVNQKI